jgi:hypothetical protein
MDRAADAPATALSTPERCPDDIGLTPIPDRPYSSAATPIGWSAPALDPAYKASPSPAAVTVNGEILPLEPLFSPPRIITAAASLINNGVPEEMHINDLADHAGIQFPYRRGTMYSGRVHADLQ